MSGFSEQIIKGTVYDLHISEPEIYVDNESRDRSGHVGHALVMTKTGRLIDFNANCSAYRNFGHSCFGWVDYRLSDDYGETFGEVRQFPYSVKVLNDGINTISVEKAVSCKDGTIIAFCLMNSQNATICCEPWGIPMVVCSRDDGETWQEANPLCDYEGRIYDAIEKDGTVYVLMHCNSGKSHFCAAGFPYRLFTSDDNGKTFKEKSIVSFSGYDHLGYGNMIFTPDGKLVVYAYNLKDECNMSYAISDDNGESWFESGKSYVANKIRNPQVNILDGQYILHGRASSDYGFVIYTSADGINWDNGTVLNSTGVSCYYSNNIVLDNPKKDGKKRMLIQYSESFQHKDGREWSPTVNIMHTWVESI